jgi:hypothetical protein
LYTARVVWPSGVFINNEPRLIESSWVVLYLALLVFWLPLLVVNDLTFVGVENSLARGLLDNVPIALALIDSQVLDTSIACGNKGASL